MDYIRHIHKAKINRQNHTENTETETRLSLRDHIQK